MFFLLPSCLIFDILWYVKDTWKQAAGPQENQQGWVLMGDEALLTVALALALFPFDELRGRFKELTLSFFCFLFL